MNEDITMHEAGESFLARCEKKHKPATFKTFSSHFRNIELFMGRRPVSEIKNGALHDLAEHLGARGLAASTIRDILAVAKAIVASCIDAERECLYPVKWNSKIIDAPKIQRTEQPAATVEEITAVLAKADSADRALIALLGASGIRIGEAQALRIGPTKGPLGDSSCWRPDSGTLSIFTSIYRGSEQTPKTESARREIELAPEINELLKTFVGGRANGFLFGNGSAPSETTLRWRLDKNLPGHGFHSLRRHRRTYLAEMNVPERIEHYWMGHAGGGVNASYNKLHRNIAIRRAEADRIGVGFQLP